MQSIFWLHAGKLGASLVSHGVTAGDRVALLAGNSLEFAVAVHGVTRVGGVLVPLNVRLTPSEIAWQLEDSDSRTLLFHEPTRQAAQQAAPEAGLATRMVVRTDAEAALYPLFL